IPNLLNLFMYYFEWSKKIITNIMSYQLQNLKNFYRIVENNIYNPLRISIVGLAWLIVGIVIILIMNYKREYDIKN
ncbi:MAG: hypothetical protein Q4P29_08240, partial [Tissierellia bacterium]|nr:hypothetical protein [Tissierellia bacterium]